METALRCRASVVEYIGNIRPRILSSPIDARSKTNKTGRNSRHSKKRLLKHRLPRSYRSYQLCSKIPTNPQRDSCNRIKNQWVYPQTQSNEKTDASPTKRQLSSRRVCSPSLCQAKSTQQEPQHERKYLNISTLGTHFLHYIVE